MSRLNIEPGILPEKGEMRDIASGSGYSIKRFEPVKAQASILCADCSFSVSELRHCAIWAAHAVSVYAKFDMQSHPDIVSGNGTQPYGSLMASNHVDMGSFIPYSDIEDRAKCARLMVELYSLSKAMDELAIICEEPGMVLIDGSILQTERALCRLYGDYPEFSAAKKMFEKVKSISGLAGLVEDSRACDICRGAGLNITDPLLFDLCLDPLEIAYKAFGDVTVCYLKLPPKELSYLAERVADPVIARWEFTGKNPLRNASEMAGMWMEENDILHTQTYPIRLADYLSRAIKTSGMIDEAIELYNLKTSFRHLRR